jgi:acyl carrier protein
MTRDEIFERIAEILADSFELDRAEIKPESTLYEDLDLDSIDAIDIFVQLREVTGRRPDPNDAKQIRTVEELVTFVEAEIAKGPEAEDAQGGPPDPREILGGGDGGS